MKKKGEKLASKSFFRYNYTIKSKHKLKYLGDFHENYSKPFQVH